ncbi:hypothetical protein [Pontibacter mangrovi]|uniref:Lipocalin-like domain-containing protein n=1 Tax=Pontibacter mangrovi TaxID=2589816 RepID=A0A501WCG1_9BACT|nr:hypothetical protein [Pontibacter mangrovi]TPE46070.1 hypothetical protein FJM65_01620 [Pontibacter mangrovi]
MRILKLLYILSLSIIAVPMLSCADDDRELIVSSKKELLTQKEWVGQVFNATWKLKLNKDGTYSNMFNGVPDKTGKWELAVNQQEIILDKGTVNEAKVAVAKLNSTELHLVPVWEIPDKTANPASFAVEMRFGH